MKNAVKYILIIFGLSIIVLFLLIVNSAKPNTKKNGFDRTFLPITAELVTLKKIDGIKDYCGSIGSRFYFSTKKPRQLIITDKELKIQKELFLPLSDYEIHQIKNKYSIIVDSTFIELYAGNIAAIYRFSVNDLSQKVYHMNLPFYTRIYRISDNSYILRGYNKAVKDQSFFKYHVNNGQLLVENNLSQVHHDGGVITAGHLNYEDHKKIFTYVHHYNNRLIVFDTNLQLLNAAHTIDTFNNFLTATTTYRLDANYIRSFNKPPTVVNQTTGLFKNKLFICSNLQADNESSPDYRSHIPVDIYTLPNARYFGSFYLPLSSDKELVKKMYVQNDRIMAIYASHVSLFKVDFTQLNM